MAVTAATIVAMIIVSIYQGRFSPSLDTAINVNLPCNSTILHTPNSVDPTTFTTCLLRSNIDQSWRLLIGLGCVPAAIALYFRLTIPETPRFTMDIERNVKQAVEDIDRFLTSGTYQHNPDSIIIRVLAPRASWKDFFAYFRIEENWKVLVGCAYSWFAIDVSMSCTCYDV